MLKAKPTTHLTGINIQGDFGDFYRLIDSIHRMTITEEEHMDVYYGVKNRLLGICYDIRHAFMGDRDIVLEDNGMNQEIMKWHEMITPTQNVYYSVNILFPEAIFVAVTIPKFYQLSACYYGRRSRCADMGLPPIPYGYYLEDKANLNLLCAVIWQALGEVIGDEELEKIIRLAQNSHEDYINYVTQYVDKCNVELLKTSVEKRGNKLKNIAKRFVKKPQTYYNMEREFKYWAREEGVSIYDLEDPVIQYPEEIVW
ncbi:hypothetical protein B5F37_06830 [Drancourtella sp. An210]|nr:hypothetical protein B5F37_06830 [Drancourtella sp. An210]